MRYASVAGKGLEEAPILRDLMLCSHVPYGNMQWGGAPLDEIIQAQYTRYPQWQAEDLLKLLYQRHCGCGHLVASAEDAEEHLLQEWSATPADGALPLWESIGGGYVRLHLAAAKAANLSPELLLRAFLASASAPAEKEMQALRQELQRVRPAHLGISPENWQACLDAWIRQGCLQVRHSQAYREAYRPAYRVVLERYARWLPLVQLVEARLSATDSMVLAIDGRSGSGKSELAECLHMLEGAAVAHMDDFFLPAQRKTPERLAQPGGNVDIERFAAEVLTPLRAGCPVCYRPYSCKLGTLQMAVSLPKARLTVVEGVYSLHPAGGFDYGMALYLTLPPQVQRQRILSRNGPAMLERYAAEWIPLEEQYFAAFRIPFRADVCFDTHAYRVVQPCQV